MAFGIFITAIICLLIIVFIWLFRNESTENQDCAKSGVEDTSGKATEDRQTLQHIGGCVVNKITHGNEGNSKAEEDVGILDQETLSTELAIGRKNLESQRTLTVNKRANDSEIANRSCYRPLNSTYESQRPYYDTEEGGTDIDRATKRQESFTKLVQQLGLNGNDKAKLTLSDGMRINSIHVSGHENDSVIENFIAKLASYDYRVEQISMNVVEQEKTADKMYTENDNDWTDSVDDEHTEGSHETSFSSRDILYAILNCLDPFFLQEVLMKLSACQIAVPILLPDITGNNAKFLLWGLRKIVKSWCCNKESSTIREETIVRHKILTVAAIRIGNIPFSKSNVLNKFLGPSQGNDEHAFFMSFEQDSRATSLCEGILECVWFLPGTEVGPISSPFALFNLRGDYLENKRQAEFAIGMAFLTIVFIDADDIKSYKKLVENIRSNSHVIVVCCHSNLQKKGRKTVSRTFEKGNYQLTQIVSQGLSALEISAEISRVTKDLIENKKQLKESSLEDAVTLAQKLKLVIDEDNDDCEKPKQLALQIFSEIKALSPEKYKLEHFPMQKHWREWSKDSKNRTWNATSGNVEFEKAKHGKQQMNTRLAQAREELSPHLAKICAFMLGSTKVKRDYFISWLQMYLNDIATEYVKPLTKQLMEKSSERRDLSNEINKMEKKLQTGSNAKNSNNDLTNIKEKEEQIAEDEIVLIKQFDEKSLGVEHYMREFGQLVESFKYTKQCTYNNSKYMAKLADVAAEMLLSGHPLEILDGDVSEVPLMWLSEVLKALVKIIRNDAAVYVISVLGIQSSGKSTLLNSMFGVRFAASAGRCTRGVYMQLLPIKGELQKQLNCEYLVIVDTEGLRAPEKSLSSYTHQDNELATFALCISNLTLINIGGQTMGEDMTNVLQIAAHAFVRMTQVNLKPECRIIQQFVADVTADQKNESAMQTILLKLDEAAREAAKKEGKEHLYRQFSDVFAVQNFSSDSTNVQYIPSLWRGFMGAPDYQYSLRVQQLKSAILHSIPKTNSSPLTLQDLHQRISDVWNAIKKEDFVFSFQNTKEVTLYQEVTYFYKNLIQPIRREVIEMELSARSDIENAKAEEIDYLIDENLSRIRDILQDRCDDVREQLKIKCSEKKYESVRKYSTYFETDLQVLQGRIESSIRSTFSRHGSIVKSAHKKDSVLQKLSEEIHDRFAEFAHTLRKQTDKILLGGNANDVNSAIDANFQTEWERKMRELKLKFPLRSLSDITEEIKLKISRNLKDVVLRSELSMEVFDLLAGDISVYTDQEFEISTQHIENLRSLFSSIDDHTEKLFETLFQYIKTVAEKPEEFEVNTPIVLEKIKEFMTNTNFVTNQHFILLYVCSKFLILVHQGQLKQELNIVLTSPSARSHVCRELRILEAQEIKPKLISFIMQKLPDHKRTPSLRDELEECKYDVIKSDDGYAKPSMWEKFLQTVHWSDDSRKVFQEMENAIKNELDALLDRNDGKCSIETVEKFATVLCQNCSKKKLPSNKDKHAVLKHFFKVGEKRFEEAFCQRIEVHINSSEYQIRHAQPRKFESLEMKLHHFLNKMKETLHPDQYRFLEQELKPKDILKINTLPHAYLLLQRIDFRFLKILPEMKTTDIEFVIKIIDKAKSLILATAQSKGTFYEDSFHRHAQDIFQTTTELENKVRAAAIVHVGAWALPVYSRRQFDFEREKNIAVLIENDRKMFETEFKSLASNCQDEMIAERFAEIIYQNLKDGLMNIFYPTMYASIITEHNEFRMKTTFIGSVLKSLFESKNISGIIAFLSNFSVNSERWILNFVANKIKNNPLWLENLMTQCIKALATSTRLTLCEASDQFQDTSGDSFPKMLDDFVLNYKNNTKLTCKNADVEKLKRYLNVSDINTFLQKCVDLFGNLEERLEEDFQLPSVTDVKVIQSWLTKTLPKRIHADIFESIKGCEKTCPFCNYVCDESLSDHPKHEVLCHLPCGLTGFRDHNSKKLNTFTCNSAVESPFMMYKRSGDEDWKSFKDYEKDYPNWRIRPDKIGEPRSFWKYLFAKYNEEFAEYYRATKADIPNEWNDIGEKEALEDLCNTYNITE